MTWLEKYHPFYKRDYSQKDLQELDILYKQKLGQHAQESVLGLLKYKE